jgi:hypothetical protein
MCLDPAVIVIHAGPAFLFLDSGFFDGYNLTEVAHGSSHLGQVEPSGHEPLAAFFVGSGSCLAAPPHGRTFGGLSVKVKLTWLACRCRLGAIAW